MKAPQPRCHHSSIRNHPDDFAYFMLPSQSRREQRYVLCLTLVASKLEVLYEAQREKLSKLVLGMMGTDFYVPQIIKCSAFQG